MRCPFQEIDKAMNALRDTATEIISWLVEVLHPLIQELVDNYEQIAYAWAENVHPEWMRIYRRTKKQRIRKKYRDRIMRAFKEAVDDGRQ